MYIPKEKLYFIDDDPFSYSHKYNKCYNEFNDNIEKWKCLYKLTNKDIANKVMKQIHNEQIHNFTTQRFNKKKVKYCTKCRFMYI